MGVPISGRSTESDGSVECTHLPRMTPCSRGALTLTARRMAFTGGEPEEAGDRARSLGAATRVRTRADPTPGVSPVFTCGDSSLRACLGGGASWPGGDR
ncbi:hypothetical protein [Archangium violaceum]|uniref:hypothetical protein n=1 Tax=Archangium violaceum TaxID=83451 RepID=UPI0036D7DFEE